MKHGMKIWTLVVILSLIGIASAQDAPEGEYGDAPDGQQTFWAIGRFPTLYDSTSGLMGGHTLVVGQEMIGTTASAETDADDAVDPDGTPNLVDEDLDDPIYISIVAVAIPAPAKISFPVTIDDSAPVGPRYINVLLDFDRNGSWGGDVYGKEWAVQNEPIEVPPGSTQMFTSDWFNWGGGLTMPSRIWGRAAITRSPIDIDNWRGEGEFQYGEIQDFFVELRASNNTNKTNKTGCGNNRREGAEKCDGTDDAACPGKCRADCTCPGGGGGGEDGGPGGPGPRKGPCTTPVGYHALIINAGDNPERQQAIDSADDMWETLDDQGYDSITSLGPAWDGIRDGDASLAGIEKAFDDLKSKVKCVDRVMIYIIGHGLKTKGKKFGKSWPSGGIVLQSSGEILTPEKLKQLLEKIPACPNEDCKTPEKNCHMSVVIESCHSGNFFNSIKGTGRTVAVSAASNEVAFFGKDKNGDWHGGDYSNGYVKDMYSPSTSDTNKDGFVSVAEAHASAEAKLSVGKANRKSQTPQIDSQECDCLPLTCGPKCELNEVIDPGEDCDPTASPDGCPSNEVCNDDCECEPRETIIYCELNEVLDPGEECDPTASPTGCTSTEICTQECECEPNDIIVGCEPPEYTFYGECDAACDTGECILNDNGCYICYETGDACPDPNEYTPEECEAKIANDPEKRCVCGDVCCYIQSICDRGEYYNDPNCGNECDAGEYCGMTDERGPCYACGLGDVEPTCDDRGMYDSQGACEADCDSPDSCEPHEGSDCWYCQGVSCGAGLYESSDCDGACDSNENCESYQSTGCYYCAGVPCPDLIVTSLTGGISKHGSYSGCPPQGQEGSCTHMVCTLTGEVFFQIRNSGSGNAGTSSARVTVSHGVHDQTVSVSPLNSGQTSATYSASPSKFYSGSGSDCSTRDWWASTYTISIEADSGDAVNECNENNNVASGQTQSQN